MINSIKRHRLLLISLTAVLTVAIVILSIFFVSRKSPLQSFYEATGISATDKNVLYMTEDKGFSRHLLMRFDSNTAKDILARKQPFQNCQTTNISCSQGWMDTVSVSPKISFPISDLSVEYKEILKELAQPPTKCAYSVRSSHKEAAATLDTSNTERQILCINPHNGEASYAYLDTIGV